MDKEELNKIISEQVELRLNEMVRLHFGDKFLFDRHSQYLDGRNIITGLANGTTIGTVAAQKIGFHGSTSIQASAIAAPSTPSAGYVQAEAQTTVDKVNEIITALENKGIIA